MIKSCLLLIVLSVALPQIIRAQKQDVLYLKNNNVIRGSIVNKNDTAYTIQTADGSLYTYPAAGIDSIKREKSYRNYVYKKSGFAHFTELGPLIAGKTNINGVTTAAFSFQTVNGYKVNQYLMAGLGIGADLYATQTILPLFISVRGDLAQHGNVLPFYFVESGWGINITQKSAGADDFKGGFTYAGGLGLKIPFNRSAGFLLGLGYRYQKTSYNNNSVNTNVLYKRLALRAGFFL